jgi:hypothetical protein
MVCFSLLSRVRGGRAQYVGPLLRSSLAAFGGWAGKVIPHLTSVNGDL